MIPHQISVSELATLLAAKVDLFLLDVRTPEEYQQFNLGGYLIPISELAQRIAEIPTDKEIIVYCRSGHRSQVALEWLQQQGLLNIKNLSGGVLAWQQQGY